MAGKYKGPAQKPAFESRVADSNQDKRPIFCFRYLDQSLSCFCCLDSHYKKQFHDTYDSLSKMTWAEIQQAPHKGFGAERLPRNRLHFEIPQCALPVMTPDIDKVMVFRFAKISRIIGLRRNEFFHVIWIDHLGKAYDHGS